MLDFNTVLAKWLKKAKLRDGRHSVGLFCTTTFYYRGFPLGVIEDDRVRLKYPATLKAEGWPSLLEKEYILAADPKFFIKLRKALRVAMTAINAVSIAHHWTAPAGLKKGGGQQAAAKE
jgi:hypothetical protein